MNKATHPLPVAQGAVLSRCIETYGKQKEVDVAIEEMSELTKALLKERREDNTMPGRIMQARMNIADEMADVIIMLTQLTMIFDNWADVQEFIMRKLERQEERLNGAGNENGEECNRA